MTSDLIREALSRYVDGEMSSAEVVEIEELLESSGEARRYLERLQVLRSELREGESESHPDVVAPVMATIHRLQWRPRRRLSLSAVFAAGVVAGAVFIGFALRYPGPIAAADIPDEVVAAQGRVNTLTATVDIVERGLHPEVPERRFTGRIQYLAPESISIEIRDNTVYPSSDWVPNDSTVVVDDDVSWSRAVAGCPTEALPECTPSAPREMLTVNREPFPETAPAPLDLIVPVAGFTRAAEPVSLGVAEIDGHGSVGVSVTAAQVAALLDGLVGAGNWRDIHPTDRVELWLDQSALVPLAVTVYPADTSDRSLWAIRRGYDDSPRTPILEVSWSEVAVDSGVSLSFPSPPEGLTAVDGGFDDELSVDVGDLDLESVPDEMTPHRSGILVSGEGPKVSVASWSDGRAWVEVRWTSEWRGSHLFGDLGALVREVPLDSGVGYLNERGDRVGVHGDEIDLVVRGSLPTEALVEIAGDLAVIADPVPPSWAESAAATLETARTRVPGLLVPHGLEGFGSPAIRVTSDVVTLSYAGPGNRAFLLTQAMPADLSPPLEAKVRGVTVRGVEGRYSPDRGLLEWVEGDLTIGLVSATLSIDELIVIAESLGAP